MKVKIGDQELEIRPVTFGEHKQILKLSGFKWSDSLDETTIGPIIRAGLKVQHGITITDEELDAMPSRRVQRIVLELLRDTETDEEVRDPFGTS
jgi:hypothetical protein